MKNLFAFASVLLLFGCATSSDVFLPDGSKGFSVSCNGSANSISSCFEKAGEICGAKGYDLLSRDGDSNLIGYGVASATPSNGAYVSQYGMLVTRSIMFKCKG